MEISLETTPFLEREVAVALCISIGEVREYCKSGLCGHSVQLLTGFGTVLDLPNFFDVVQLGIIHSLRRINRVLPGLAAVGDEVADTLALFLLDTDDPDPLGPRCCRRFIQSMSDDAESGFLENYFSLQEHERRLVARSVVRTCLCIRQRIFLVSSSKLVKLDERVNALIRSGQNDPRARFRAFARHSPTAVVVHEAVAQSMH
ncbi:hypothetical protein TG4357_02636 [Thalassovita gelatinovora]|uniref:Uncharacterized protein n=1 Tax=Thalassovita gelatinovora TaxID=53501 RepID=A0A0N7LVN4_THAGE|nr:hypothetical protein TG4357_02636 [Thalassovita gelatinovora]SEQ42703.1 hypothetical protein SAMN04488043_105173 [Thalassovita gelatinovora]